MKAMHYVRVKTFDGNYISPCGIWFSPDSKQLTKVMNKITCNNCINSLAMNNYYGGGITHLRDFYNATRGGLRAIARSDWVTGHGPYTRNRTLPGFCETHLTFMFEDYVKAKGDLYEKYKAFTDRRKRIGLPALSFREFRAVCMLLKERPRVQSALVLKDIRKAKKLLSISKHSWVLDSVEEAYSNLAEPLVSKGYPNGPLTPFASSC